MASLKQEPMVKKVCMWIVLNLFIFTCLYMTLSFFTGFGFGFQSVVSISVVFLILYYFKSRKLDCVDGYMLFLIFFYILTGVFNWGNDYTIDTFFLSLRYFVLGMLFFFLGRTKIFADDRVFNNMLIVLTIYYIISLYLYFAQPSWYGVLRYVRYSELYGYSESGIDNNYDLNRMTGFGTYPYYISYSAFLFISYMLLRKLSSAKLKIIEVLQILLGVVTSLLAAQRSPIAFSGLALIMFFIYQKSSMKIKFVALSLLIIISLLLFTNLNISNFEYAENIREKLMSFTDSYELMQKRSDIGQNRMYVATIPFFGKGLNSSIGNISTGKGIWDNGWLLMLHEVGIIGVFLLAIFVIYALLIAVKDIKYNIFEILVILFFLFSMIGANSLSDIYIKNSLFFWLCLGRIFNKDCLQWKKESENNTNKKKYGKESTSDSILSASISSDT